MVVVRLVDDIEVADAQWHPTTIKQLCEFEGSCGRRVVVAAATRYRKRLAVTSEGHSPHRLRRSVGTRCTEACQHMEAHQDQLQTLHSKHAVSV